MSPERPGQLGVQFAPRFVLELRLDDPNNDIVWLPNGSRRIAASLMRLVPIDTVSAPLLWDSCGRGAVLSQMCGQGELIFSEVRSEKI